MVKVKEQLQEHYELRQGLDIARVLGISYEELQMLEWELMDNIDEDGTLRGYIVVFSNECPQEILKKVERLESGRRAYISPNELGIDQEIYWEIYSSEQLKTYKVHVASVKQLLGSTHDEETYFRLLVMLHAHIVAATEYFLSSTFIHEVLGNEYLMRKLVETDPIIAKQTFSLRDIYREQEKLKETVARHLKSVIFHDIAKAKEMYKSVLDYDMEDISWLCKAVLKRHDCAHRAGYDRNGVRIKITKSDVEELLVKCSEFCEKIDDQLVGLF